MENWNRRQFLATGTAALAALGLSGCDGGDDKSASPKGRGEAVHFLDLDGRRITLDRPAGRIVTLGPPYAAMAVAVHGSPDRLVGIHPRARDMYSRSFVREMFPEIMTIPTNIAVGGDFTPNVEGIARLQPDIVVQWAEMGDALIAPLENAGITVARYRSLEAGAEATLAAMLTMFGEMIGDTARAERLNAQRAQTGRRLAEMVGTLSDASRQRVLLMTRTGEAMYASGGGSEGLYSYYIYRAGGINVAEALPDYSPVSREQIAALDPDVILLFGSDGETPRSIFGDPVLQSTQAALQRRVYVLPTGSHYWGAIGPDDALTQIWLAELLYPDRLEKTLRGEMRETYRAMFDQDFSDARIDEILMLETNGISAGYERFRV
ncbi:periplasmic binding protein [Nitratireductor aquibiodomus RA22]|uniref:Periplasmic binding protein n=1 Tax=Nitratireductor aquibiodomus RA22 TaxID=1189611 RepID=I5BVC5_9HYPH|nr:ABC transporter substrate-binding protein [Nitratireductor aquibiodomus]EIM73527.1 periplasmic binding protein [Nitratireductor aquibiodomus RA22]